MVQHLLKQRLGATRQQTIAHDNIDQYFGHHKLSLDHGEFNKAYTYPEFRYFNVLAEGAKSLPWPVLISSIVPALICFNEVFFAILNVLFNRMCLEILFVT